MRSVHALRVDLANLGLVIDHPTDEKGDHGDYPSLAIWRPDPPRVTHENGSQSTSQSFPHFEFAPESEMSADEILGSGLDERVRRAMLVKGTDGLAWYVSFHLRGVHWGIYLPTSSLYWMAESVFAGTGLPLRDRLRLAAAALHFHELFHFAVDYMTAILELITRRPCWLPGRRLREPAGYFPIEEKLANAHMLRRLQRLPPEQRGRGSLTAMKRFVSQLPPGYAEASECVSAEQFELECALLVATYMDMIGENELSVVSHVPLVERLLAVDRIDWRRCPVHLIKDEARYSLPELGADLFQSISSINETDDFRTQLERLGPEAEKAWKSAKRKLEVGLHGRGLDFKLWKRYGTDSEFSLRLSRNLRAHIVFRRDHGAWVASKVGNHSAMGHG